MITKAIRLYGKNDLRLDTFELSPTGDDGILAKVVSDSICMSSYKAAIQGPDHKRVPNNCAVNPVIIGHEFCGEIIEVGAKWRHLFSPGEHFAIQPALNDPTNVYAALGYSFGEAGGNATYVRLPSIVMERGCLLKFEGSSFFRGSLAEPISCLVGAYKVNYHFVPNSYEHIMGIVPGGRAAILAGVGPMGLGAIDHALHIEPRPSLLVVTDIDQARLDRAARIFTTEHARSQGVELHFVNTAGISDVPGMLRGLTPDGRGYDDVLVMAPVRAVVEQGVKILGYDGCLNFFAGPTDPNFSAEFNFYDLHYNRTHVAGNSGGTNQDLIDSLDYLARGLLDPAYMVTHIGGLDAVIDTTLRQPEIKGGKKLIYTHKRLPLIGLDELEEVARTGRPAVNPSLIVDGENGADATVLSSTTRELLIDLAGIVAANNGLWSDEAETVFLDRAPSIWDD